MYTGRRKTAIARVWHSDKGVLVNNIGIVKDLCLKYNLDPNKLSYSVKGGGCSGQLEAVYYAVMRLIMSEQGRSVIEESRINDTRIKERMKPGRTRARKSQPYLRR